MNEKKQRKQGKCCRASHRERTRRDKSMGICALKSPSFKEELDLRSGPHSHMHAKETIRIAQEF